MKIKKEKLLIIITKPLNILLDIFLLSLKKIYFPFLIINYMKRINFIQFFIIEIRHFYFDFYINLN